MRYAVRAAWRAARASAVGTTVATPPWIHIQSSHVSTIPAHCESKPICSTRHKMLWLSESASDEGRAVRGRERAATPAPVRSGHVLIRRSASRHQPGREGRKAPKAYGHTAIPADLLMGNYCEQVVHSRYVQLDSSPWPANGRRGPLGGRDRRAGHPRSGHMKVG